MSYGWSGYLVTMAIHQRIQTLEYQAVLDDQTTTVFACWWRSWPPPRRQHYLHIYKTQFPTTCNSKPSWSPPAQTSRLDQQIYTWANKCCTTTDLDHVCPRYWSHHDISLCLSLSLSLSLYIYVTKAVIANFLQIIIIWFSVTCSILEWSDQACCCSFLRSSQ
jgi:hypothetical protein